MDKKIIAIIILAVLLAGALLFYAYNYVLAKGYNLGKGDLIIDMNRNSYFPLIVQQNNQTIIQNRNLNDLCGGTE